MPEKNLEALFLHHLKVVYFAELQIAKTLPGMASAAQLPELRSAFETHLRETQGQIGRLEQVFDILGARPEGVPGEGILGLIKEAEAAMRHFAGGEAFEAALIAAAQGIEHYEIARYGTLRAWAEQLGMPEAAEILEESLDEETDADAVLSEIAEDAVNREAV